jgi:ligand-binding sensor domain-containing protein
VERPPTRPFSGFLRWAAAVLAWGLLPFAFPVSAQVQSGIPEGRPAVRVFSDRDGLPQNGVRSMAFDRHGRLWAGTKDGACVYNGIAWRVVNMPNRNRSNFVTVVSQARDGGMWFGTEGGGLLHLKNDRWTQFDTSNGLPGNDVTGILETDRDELWVTTQSGVGHRRAGRWRTFSKNDGLPSNISLCLIETTCSTGEKIIVVGTSRGIVLRRGERWILPREAGLPANPWVLSLLETKLGDGTRRLMIGTQSGLFHLELDRLLNSDDGTWLKWEALSRDGRPPLGIATGPFVFALITTRTKTGEPILWAGTGIGVLRLQNGEWHRYDAEDGLPVTGVWSLVETPNQGNSIWIGTSGGGIARLHQGGWKSFTTANGLAGNSTYSLMETVTGEPRVWIGSLGGLVRLGDGKRIVFPEDDLENVVALASSRDESGREVVWAGTTGGMYEYSGGRWKIVSRAVVSALTLTRDATGKPILWVGMADGLLCLHDEKVTRYSTADGLPGNRIRCLLPTTDLAGRPFLWVGTQSGVTLAAIHDTFACAGTGTGPAAGSILGLKETRATNGARFLWVGTGNGVLRGKLPETLDSTTIGAIQWESLTEQTSPALPNNTVYRIETDKSGSIYLCTNKGVARVTFKDGFAETPLKDAAVQVFSIEDGLPSRECNTGASMVDHLGRIWVGTIGGVAVLEPETLLPTDSPKPLLIEGARFFEQSPSGENTSGEPGVSTDAFPTGNLEFAHNRNNVTFQFALLSFFREADTRYRTQLVGLEENPSDWSPAPRRDYTTLPNGHYVFRVWGRDAQDNISGPAEIAFVIRPAPWRTWWAIGLYVLAGGVAVFIGFRLRLRQLVLRQERLSELVAERTRDLTDEKEKTEAALDRIRQLNERLAVANTALEDANLQERERAMRAMATAQQSQLLMLRYQVNPHFLFNVLNSIWALVDENPAAIRSLVTRLSKFLRYSLATANTAFVTLDEEIGAVRNYLEIQQTRFEQKLECEIDVSPEAGSVTIPPFLLQPLVENAIKFGMRTSNLPLKIRISARMRRETLMVRVMNSGKWVTPDSNTGEEGTGIGLANIRRRIGELFPENSELRSFHRGGWVSFRLRLRLPTHR